LIRFEQNQNLCYGGGQVSLGLSEKNRFCQEKKQNKIKTNFGESNTFIKKGEKEFSKLRFEFKIDPYSSTNVSPFHRDGTALAP